MPSPKQRFAGETCSLLHGHTVEKQNNAAAVQPSSCKATARSFLLLNVCGYVVLHCCLARHSKEKRFVHCSITDTVPAINRKLIYLTADALCCNADVHVHAVQCNAEL